MFIRARNHKHTLHHAIKLLNPLHITKYVLHYIIMQNACMLTCVPQCFMEPMKKVQVEGHLMFAEPQDLFGNLDELCYVSL